MLQANKEKMKNLISLLAVDDDHGYRTSIEKLKHDLNLDNDVNFKTHDSGGSHKPLLEVADDMSRSKTDAKEKAGKSTVASSNLKPTEFIYSR